MLLVMKMPTGTTLNVVIAVVLAVVIVLLGMGALLLVRMLASREVKRGTQQKQKPVVEGHQIYRGTGKCIDCESQFKDEQWRGGSNKCYDCEKDLVARTGSGYGAMKSKCFDC